MSRDDAGRGFRLIPSSRIGGASRTGPADPPSEDTPVAATVIGTNLVIDYGSEEAARAALDSWPGLDGVWREVEAALPKVRTFDKGKRVPDAEVTSLWTLELRRWDSGYHAFAYDYTEDTDRRSWLGGLEAHGSGPTPEAALRRLARLLPTQASDSPEKTT